MTIQIKAIEYFSLLESEEDRSELFFGTKRASIFVAHFSSIICFMFHYLKEGMGLKFVSHKNVTRFIVNYPCLFQRLQSVKCLLWLPKKTLNYCKTHLHACCKGPVHIIYILKGFEITLLLGTQFTLV